MTRILFLLFISFSWNAFSQQFDSLYKKNKTLTYEQLIGEYKKLDAQSTSMKLLEYGKTDGGLPIHLLVVNKLQQFTPPGTGRKKGTVLLIMNGIHPGECEGMDASLFASSRCTMQTA
jgi:hypothetical protein